MIKKSILFFAILFFIVCENKSYSQSTRSFTGKPIYEILVNRSNVYLGTITVELFPNIAPNHVQNFDSLVSVHFFDTTAFHRVIPGFMIQGGDPNSRHGDISTWGYGDPNQPTVNAEFTTAKHLRGTLSAARDTDINSANSQFFICVAPASWLNGQYSVYGHVTAGMNIVDTIVNSPRDANDNPLQKMEMFVTYTGSNDSIPTAATLNSPADGTTGVGTSKVLRWNAVSDAIIYHLEVSTDSLFSTIFKSVDIGATALLANITGLQGATTYYWRVKINNGGHFSAYSNKWRFTTSGSAGIESYDNTINQIQISPNPSAAKFVFSNLFIAPQIEIENELFIYDISGRLVYKAVSKNDVAIVDLSEKEKGIYFYKIISSNKKIRQGKIILQ